MFDERYLLSHPICLSSPRRLTQLSAWHEHIPFAMYLVDVLKPTIIVELGTHAGDSYCAFCQAVQDLGLKTRCYAVDTWRGDSHAGYYGDDVLADLRPHHDPLYGAFSSLMRDTFDHASEGFDVGSVDLLHIDGNHTYESAKHDFETWLPKMSARGIVLFHDICVKEYDFSVWKLWDELSPRYRSFAFTHGHGLGVLAVGSHCPAEMEPILNASLQDTEEIRSCFAGLGRRVALLADETLGAVERDRLEQEVRRLRIAVQLQQRELAKIYGTTGWGLIRRWTEFVERRLPRESRRRGVYDRFVRGEDIFRRDGLGTFLRKCGEKVLGPKGDEESSAKLYDLWQRQHEPDKAQLVAMRRESTGWSHRPKISIITPICNPSQNDLTECIQSVLDQTYDNWELCLVDGGADAPHVGEIINRFAGREPRIKHHRLPKNLGMAGNSNKALQLATGDFVAFLDHDDMLAPFALHEVVRALDKDPTLDLLYSDEDKVSPSNGRRHEPFFKPDWSPDTFLSYNYLCHFAVIRRTLIDRVGGLWEGYDGSQDYDLILRITELTSKIKRIPKVLYHWRAAPTSVASGTTIEPYAVSAAKKALMEHLEHRGLAAEVLDGYGLGAYRIRYRVRPSEKITIAIPIGRRVDQLQRCILSILTKTDYRHFNLVLVGNQAADERTQDVLGVLQLDPRTRVIRFEQAVGVSACDNYAVKTVDSDYVVFLGENTEIISPGWLSALLEFAQRRDVGAVGAKLYGPDNTVQHGGMIIGLGGIVGNAFRGFPRSSDGYMGRLNIVQNVSAVSADCMMIRRSVFEEVGGFDERLSQPYNEVDFCLKIRDKGYLIVYTPYAELYCHASPDNGAKESSSGVDEEGIVRARWKHVFDAGDPYYNPNLTLDREDFSLNV